MPIPDYETLMLPVLRQTAAGVQRIPEMVPHLVDEFQLVPEEAAEILPSGRASVLSSRAHWARTYMSKAGLVEPMRRGHFIITETGRALLDRNPTRIDNTVLATYPDFAAWKARSARKRNGTTNDRATQAAVDAGPATSASETPEDRIRAAVTELESSLADDFLTSLRDGSPALFEQAVVALLLAMGYGRGREGAGRILGKSGDGGIDGIINEDALGLDAVYVQAKRYAPENTVGRPAIQQFVGSLTGEGASKGVFVTTSSFSRDATDYAARVTQRVILIDGQRLAELMIEHGVGVRPTETITVSEIDKNFFAED